MPLDPQELTRTAATALAQATSKTGSTLRDDGIVDLGWGELFVRPAILQVQEPAGGGVMLAIGFEVAGPSLSRPMRDLAVGIAPSEEGAIQIGIQAFLAGPLAVLHDALGDAAVPYRYEIMQTNTATGEQVQWSIFESSLQLGGDPTARTEIEKGLLQKPLFVRLAEAGVLPPLQPAQVHWLRLHAARDGEQPAFMECVFDNAPWPEGQKVLTAFEWPKRDGPQTFRQYWVFTVN